MAVSFLGALLFSLFPPLFCLYDLSIPHIFWPDIGSRSNLQHVPLPFLCFQLFFFLHPSLPRPRRGLRGIVFTRSVCVSVCLSVCVYVCPANILVFYFSAIRRDIDLKFIQDTYMVVLNSLKLTFICQRSRSQGRYLAF